MGRGRGDFRRSDGQRHREARPDLRRAGQRQDGRDLRYQPTDAFRTVDPEVRPQGDPFAGDLIQELVDPETPDINTYKFSAAYQFNPDIMAYLTYAEGFTSAGEPLTTIGPNSVEPPGCVRVSVTQARCALPA